MTNMLLGVKASRKGAVAGKICVPPATALFVGYYFLDDFEIFVLQAIVVIRFPARKCLE